MGLVGRNRELVRLRGWLDGIAAGCGRVALLEGEAGIGKTRLLAELVVAARGRGFTVLPGRAHELAQDQPFRAIASALHLRAGSPDPERAAIARMLREGANHQFRLLDDILTLVERAALQGPVLLTIDDLHWTDAASLATLDHVARHSAGLPVGIAGTLRPAPGRPEPARFRRSAEAMGALHLALEPLAPEAVAQLAAEAAGGRPGSRLLRHLRGAGGNPLYVRELTRALRAVGAVRPVDGADGRAVDLTVPVLPTSFRRLVLDRVATLPEPSVALLRLASVLGSAFSAGDLSAVAGQPAGAVARALAPAIDDGLVGESDGELAFRHQLVRDAIYEDVPRSLRAALHLQAGRALATVRAPASRVAAQFSLGAERGDAEAVGWLARAAGESLATAPAMSVDHLERAIELAGHGHPALDHLLAERAQALVWAGRADRAAEVATELLERVRDGPLEPEVRRTLIHAHVLLGHGADSAAQAESLACRSGLDERVRAVSIGDAALAHIMCGDLARATELAGQAAALADSVGDDLARSVACSAQAMVAYFEARLPEALRQARRAEALAERAPELEAAVRPNGVWLGLCLADTERFEEAREQIQRARGASERLGLSWHLALYHSAAGRMGWLAGAWDDAVAEMQTSIRVAEEELGIRWAAPQQQSYLACIAVHRDEQTAAVEALAAAERGFAECGPAFGMEVLVWARALLHEARGELAEAVALLAGGWSILTGGGFLTQCLALGPDLVRLALATGDRALALAASEGVEEAARRTGLASAAGVALRCRGLVEDDAGLLLEAVERLRQGRRRIELAYACEDAGIALARARRRQGVALIDEAIAIYRRVGARRDVGRAVAGLRRLGVRRRADEGARRPERGWEALTATEHRVVELAALGLTNPEIGSRLAISRRTVETHLSHVFGKLGVSSRVELAAAHARRAS
jgi:DNA-binding CsgD family transcriptional regulator